jgi:hypothetical protein
VIRKHYFDASTVSSKGEFPKGMLQEVAVEPSQKVFCGRCFFPYMLYLKTISVSLLCVLQTIKVPYGFSEYFMTPA